MCILKVYFHSHNFLGLQINKYQSYWKIEYNTNEQLNGWNVLNDDYFQLENIFILKKQLKLDTNWIQMKLTQVDLYIL
ncbi:hypothetical protein DERP_010589 [Dermatophagoides pteronyssinus]|uniref:Uncharacterized protein n=1 Tax=Dermatophagoides pteronyssinus TaxID=6956 RepID=A0ABQ8JG96_DERPT|nr:hypothetical protein DERP_010589 [Dermatophagoides pteronyssinus]